MLDEVEIRVMELLQRLSKTSIIGAEIGVARGDMSAAMLQLHDNLFLYMIDSYLENPEWQELAEKATKFAALRRNLLIMDSLEAAKRITSRLDFVFIDADHNYKAVKADILAWYPVIKSGGLLSGHDYCLAEIGVIKAVDEAVKEYNWKLECGANETWFIKIP